MKLSPSLALFLFVSAAPVSCQSSCDCDGDGVSPTILDALAAAQLAAGLSTPTMAQQSACDPTAPAGIDVVDALTFAQGAAGLPVALACAAPPAPPSCTIVVPGSPAQLAPGRNTVSVDVQDPNMDPLTVTLELSTDSGVTWTLAAMAAGSPTPNPATAVPTPSTADFLVDMTAFPVLGLVTAEVRVQVDDGASTSTCSDTVLLNTVIPVPSGSSIVFLADHSASMGWGVAGLDVPGLPAATPWQAAQFLVVQSAQAMSASEDFTVGLFNHTYVTWMYGLATATAASTQAAGAWTSGQYATGGTTIAVALAAMIAIPGGPPARLILVAGPVAGGVLPPLPAPYPSTIVDVIQLGGVVPDTFLQGLALQNGGLFRHYP